ncbi:MAG: rod shape-determining protein MreD [Candidatus Limnocylindria bacterium]
MRIALAVLIPVAAALLQGSVAPFLSLGGARPNMPILVAASWSVAAGAREAIWWAFIGGLAADLLSGGPLGAFAIASLPAVAVVGLGERSLVRPVPVLVGAGLVGLATLLAGLLYVAVLALAGHPIPAPASALAGAVGSAVFTGALALVAYPVARALRRATESDSPF